MPRYNPIFRNNDRHDDRRWSCSLVKEDGQTILAFVSSCYFTMNIDIIIGGSQSHGPARENRLWGWENGGGHFNRKWANAPMRWK